MRINVCREGKGGRDDEGVKLMRQQEASPDLQVAIRSADIGYCKLGDRPPSIA